MSRPAAKVQERAPIFGITLEEPAHVPENLGLPDGVEVPCRIEQKVHEIIQKHRLDRSDFKTSTVLNIIRQIRIDHPNSSFTEALTDNHAKNIEKNRWDVYPSLSAKLPKS